MLSLAEAKEKALKALSARKLMERGWLSALVGYLAKREELSVRLKYIGDVRLQREEFEILAIFTYYASKCWPGLPEELARTFSSSLEPRRAFSLLLTGLSLASSACKLQSSGNKVSINMSPESLTLTSWTQSSTVSINMSPKRLSLEVNGVSAALNPNCVTRSLSDVFVEVQYEVPEVLSGLRGKDVIDVGANVGDTALYFVLNGARKVIAVEPLPNVAKCAEENLRLNGAADKVKVINAALSDEPVSIPCNTDTLLSAGFSTLKGNGPCKVPGVTLGYLLNMVEDPYLLKMDCEGCEAQVILGPEREKLRAFEHIIFETHPHITSVSNEKLLASLKELGFECRLHRVLSQKVELNIYHCKNSKPR
ncbi:MAG: FkbM family methyltransferase [Acidianus sp.]|nr:FkbM family methyltransferase [Acidianus sp.]